jgi:hypothetical protein
MRDTAFQTWRRECEAVEREMNRLITTGLPASLDERPVRRTQFAALIERRETAARNLLQSNLLARRLKSSTDTLHSGDPLAAANSEGVGGTEPQTGAPLHEEERKAQAPTRVTALSCDTVAPDHDNDGLPSAAAVVTPGAGVYATEPSSNLAALAANEGPFPLASATVDGPGASAAGPHCDIGASTPDAVGLAADTVAAEPPNSPRAAAEPSDRTGFVYDVTPFSTGAAAAGELSNVAASANDAVAASYAVSAGLPVVDATHPAGELTFVTAAISFSADKVADSAMDPNSLAADPSALVSEVGAAPALGAPAHSVALGTAAVAVAGLPADFTGNPTHLILRFLMLPPSRLSPCRCPHALWLVPMPICPLAMSQQRPRSLPRSCSPMLRC